MQLLAPMTDAAPLAVIGLGTQEILLIALIVVLLFGAKKIPELAKGMGEGIKNFKTAMKQTEDKPDEEKKQA